MKNVTLRGHTDGKSNVVKIAYNLPNVLVKMFGRTVIRRDRKQSKNNIVGIHVRPCPEGTRKEHRKRSVYKF